MQEGAKGQKKGVFTTYFTLEKEVKNEFQYIKFCLLLLNNATVGEIH